MSVVAKPKGGRAVMNLRRSPAKGLDFMPTPPWGTRALFHHVLPDVRGGTCWEPAAGLGHMAEVLREFVDDVYASDVFDYGVGYAVGNFAARGTDLVPDLAACPWPPDWIFTNPPFSLGLEFALRALAEARRGVALLMRSNWTEGDTRFRELFSVNPPSIVAQFVERLPMHEGRWEPDGDTMTAYSWFVWDRERPRLPDGYLGKWIPPGCRHALEREDDRRRFAGRVWPPPERGLI